MLDESGIAGSRKRIPTIRLLQPVEIAEAQTILGSEAAPLRIHAGGLDLTNSLKLEEREVTLLDVTRMSVLKHTSLDDSVLEIGAAMTHERVARDPNVAAYHPRLPEYIAGLGNIRVRMQGTIGGNVMSRDPNYEMLPVLAVLGARLTFVTARDAMPISIDASDWISSRTLHANHLLVSIAIPRAKASLVWFRELRPVLGFVAALRWCDDRVVEASAALVGDRRGPHVHRLAFPDALTGDELRGDQTERVAQWAAAFADIDTGAGPGADYCRHVLKIWLRRALVDMLGRPT